MQALKGANYTLFNKPVSSYRTGIPCAGPTGAAPPTASAFTPVSAPVPQLPPKYSALLKQQLYKDVWLNGRDVPSRLGCPQRQDLTVTPAAGPDLRWMQQSPLRAEKSCCAERHSCLLGKLDRTSPLECQHIFLLLHTHQRSFCLAKAKSEPTFRG